MVEIHEIVTDKTDNKKTGSNCSIPAVLPVKDPPTKVDQFNDLMCQMNKAREKWIDEDDDDPNDPLNNAIHLAIEQGRGWGPGQKEAYLEQILDDDFIPPLFANSVEEVAQSGLQEAFTSLIYDQSPTELLLQFRKKGNECFANGKRNEVQNVSYYREAVNQWYEAFAWAMKVESMEAGDLAQADTNEVTYTEAELDDIKSTICSNIALAHTMLSNWGHVRDECKKALIFNDANVKAWFRMAKAYQMLKDFEEAGNAIDRGLAIPGEEDNKDLLKLHKQLGDKVRKARQLRQQRERARAERVSKVKAVWKHCQLETKNLKIHLGRVPLVASVTDDEDKDDHDEYDLHESKWHNHLPHSGLIPTSTNNEWSWPCMFLYPSHNQSDFIEKFREDEVLAMRMIEVFPELEDDRQETSMPWDFNNEFTCSQLAVYFEVHESALATLKDTKKNVLVHPENVELLHEQGSCMRFYESTRALKGDEGVEIANLVRLLEQKHLGKQRRAWKKEHGSLWSKPDPNPVVRVHPAMSLRDILSDPRMVVPNVRSSE